MKSWYEHLQFKSKETDVLAGADALLFTAWQVISAIRSLLDKLSNRSSFRTMWDDTSYVSSRRVGPLHQVSVGGGLPKVIKVY